MRNVIIDSPLTFDTAGAIALAAKNKDINIVGVSSVYGREISTTGSEAGLKELLARLGIAVPIARGAESPIYDDYRWDGFPDSCNAPRIGDYAWDLFYKKAVEFGGNLEIVAVGPLTNLGIFIKKYHDQKRMIKKVTVLGSTKLFGDAASYSEFNIWADPLAAEILSDSEIPFEMIGLDLVGKAKLGEEELHTVAAYTSSLTGLTPPDAYPPIDWLDYDTADFTGLSKTIGMAAFLYPTICSHIRYHMKAEVHPTEMRGRTIFYDRAVLAEVFNAINAEALCKEKLLEVFGG